MLASRLILTLMTPPASMTPARDPLPPCPPTPNCVCSEDPDPAHQIPPLAFTGPPEAAMERLRRVVLSFPGTTEVRGDPGHLRVICRTRLLRFVDDVEFRLDAEKSVIHVRSASRVGYSDLGTNRRRVERIRAAFNAAGPASGGR